MQKKIVIPTRFQGPPNTGNGGYVSGLLGKYHNGAVEVTLRKPPPMEKELTLNLEEGNLLLNDQETLIASGKLSELDLEIPECPSLEVAEVASENYERYKAFHTFPNCFVCGYKRKIGKGLRIFTGQYNEENLFASPWIPYQALANGDGLTAKEFLWAALDCPGAFAAMGQNFAPMVLGRMTGQVYQSVEVEKPAIVIGWNIEKKGRKHMVGTAVFNHQQELCAAAKSIWFEIDPTKY